MARMVGTPKNSNFDGIGNERVKTRDKVSDAFAVDQLRRSSFQFNKIDSDR